MPKKPSRSKPLNSTRFWVPTWQGALSAVLIVAAFPPWDQSCLIWVALVPWLLELRRAEHKREALKSGLWLGILMCLLGFTWVATALHQYGPLPWPVSIAGLLLFSLTGQPQFAFFALLWVTLKRQDAVKGRSLFDLRFAPALALAYAGMDWLIPKLFTDTLGHSLYNAPLARQSADAVGAFGLTALILLSNLAIAGLIARLRDREEPSYWPTLRAATPLALIALLAFGGNLLYGRWRALAIQVAMSSSALGTVNAAAIQANIGDFDKIAAERGIRGAADKVLATYIDLSEQALGLEDKPDFLVWPETAYPSTFRKPSTPDDLFRDQKIEELVKARGVPLLFGGYDRTIRPAQDFNALFALAPDGDLQIYQKNILLLFGEYIPGAQWITSIKTMFPQVGNFGRGIGPSVLKVRVPRTRIPSGEIGFSPVICYEALFPDYTAEAARKGSQLILNITNDSWFGPWGEPHLHLALTAFRSIESRIPQLRATNTGISALILPDGEITQATPLNKPKILSARIPILQPVPTLIKAWGDWFGRGALLASILWLGGLIGFRTVLRLPPKSS